MSSKAPKQTESNLAVIQPKPGQNQQPNDFSQRSYVRRTSTSSTIASNYSSPSTSTSYADKIKSLCAERNEKKLLLEKHYLTQRNEEAESRILSIEEEKISVLEPLARLVALEQEYRFGKFTTIRREEEVVREIGKLKYQIPRLPNWSDKFNDVDPSKTIRQHDGGKRYLEKRIKSNEEYLKKIEKVLTQISNAQPQSVQASVRSRPVESSAQVKPSARPQLAESSAQPHQSSPSRRQQDDRTIKVTHLPRYMEVSQLEQELSGIFGDADSLGSTLSYPVQRLYVAPSKNIAFITYFKKEDAETAVERLSKCHLGYNILRVDFASPRSDNA